ncbi:MAG: Ubiquitin-like protein [Cirrosporium novae-zelandiae]|nr:MAG: Ubiquitin-like protein [Cirrosporium novae-zelandiae]
MVTSPDSSRNVTPIPDEDHVPTVPLTMSASVVLSSLPKDASAALQDVDKMEPKKVTIHFQPIGGAPILRRKTYKISATQRFETVVNFLRKQLGCKPSDSVFLYVNSIFAPGLDEGVGGLWRCFKRDEMLMVSYSMTPAFG